MWSTPRKTLQYTTPGCEIMRFNKHLLRSFTHQTLKFKGVSDHVLFFLEQHYFLSFGTLNRKIGMCKVVDLSVAVTCSQERTDGLKKKKLPCCFSIKSVI